MDLDGDGHLDLVSGSWPGEIFFFKGGPGRTFAAPVMLKDKDGNIINIGGGMKEEPGGGILITGNADFEKTDKGTFVNYNGKRLESTAEKPISITGTASAVHAFDWNGDGKVDLIVGNISGQVFLIPNEAKDKGYAFGKEKPLEAAGKPIRVEGGDAGPFVADWDGDGKPDLLVGAGDGSVWFYRNVGTAKAPELAKGVMLVKPGEAEYGDKAPKDARRGMRSKICVVDWNGDGRPDLLVGDFATQAPDRPEPTAEEKAAHDKARKELEGVRVKFSELIQKVHGPNRIKDKEASEKVQKELKATSERMQELYKKIPPEYENHGWVWLFLRQPTDGASGAR